MKTILQNPPLNFAEFYVVTDLIPQPQPSSPQPSCPQLQLPPPLQLSYNNLDLNDPVSSYNNLKTQDPFHTHKRIEDGLIKVSKVCNSNIHIITQRDFV